MITERTSRLLSIERSASLPPAIRRSLTFHNGTEFAQHFRLGQQPGLPTFFCDTHAPWQKGGIENAIGRMRRPLPRKTDLATITDDQLQGLIARYNDTPRKCLAFRTPNEVFCGFMNRVSLQT